MAKGWIWFWVGCAVVLASGCASTAYKAPVKERSTARKPVVKVVRAAPDKNLQTAKRPTIYQVQPGDTLYKIAFDLGLDYRTLAIWNDLADPGVIRIGEILRLTPPPVALAKSVTRPVTPSEKVVVSLPAGPDDVPEQPPERWVWPTRGEILTSFDPTTGKKGIDLAAQRGAPVLATAGGKVVYAGVGLRGYGKLIIIKHSQKILSAYGHQEQLFVSEGKFVTQGQRIGSVGDSDTDRVKLHFEIREEGKPVDPLDYLPKTTS